MPSTATSFQYFKYTHCSAWLAFKEDVVCLPPVLITMVTYRMRGTEHYLLKFYVSKKVCWARTLLLGTPNCTFIKYRLGHHLLPSSALRGLIPRLKWMQTRNTINLWCLWHQSCIKIKSFFCFLLYSVSLSLTNTLCTSQNEIMVFQNNITANEANAINCATCKL